jgi:hypothetical protein
MIEVRGFTGNTQNKTNLIFDNTLFPVCKETTTGYTHPNGTVQNLGILKNATTYFNNESARQGWALREIPITEKVTRFVILRDPFERYISGLAEDFGRYAVQSEKISFFQNMIDNNYFFDFFDFLFDANIFAIAEHSQLQVTNLQYSRIDKIGIENYTFIKMTDYLGDNLNLFLQGENIKADFTNVKLNEKISGVSDMFGLYEKIQYYFNDRRNAKRKQKLLEFLEPDYKFINSINFFNGR